MMTLLEVPVQPLLGDGGYGPQVMVLLNLQLEALMIIPQLVLELPLVGTGGVVLRVPKQAYHPLDLFMMTFLQLEQLKAPVQPFLLCSTKITNNHFCEI